jgi:tetratricopeptide (TPR) repeat protein
LQDTIRNAPTVQAYIALEGLQDAKGDIAGAIESLRAMVKLAPARAYLAHSAIGNRLRDTGQDAEAAVAEYREALRLRPDHAEARNNLGRVLIAMGRADEGVAEIREAARVRPNSFHIQISLGGVLMGRDDAASMAAYREAMRLEPSRAWVHVQLGRDLRRHGRIDEAIAAYREAARIEPRTTNCHNELALLYAAQGKYDEAVAEFREVMRINPEEPDARSNVGGNLYRAGKLDEAIVELREAARQWPENPHTRQRYGAVLFNLGRDDELALAEYRAAARLEPSVENHVGAAKLLTRLRREREAIASFREALTLVPEDSKQAAILNFGIDECERALESGRPVDLGFTPPG